jgi:hypothetical protein
MRVERALLNRCEFDLEMSEAQEWPDIGRGLRAGHCGSGGRRRATPLPGDPDQAVRSYRGTGFAEHVDQGAERDRYLSVPGIIEKQPL